MTTTEIQSISQDLKENEGNSLTIKDDKEYKIYLGSKTDKPFIITKNINPLYNLSGFVKMYKDSFKEDSIYIPDFVKEEDMKFIWDFVVKYEESFNYRLGMVTEDFSINISKPIMDEEQLRKEISNEIYFFVNKVFVNRTFSRMLDVAMCLDIQVLIEIICAKIALDIKFMPMHQLQNYFR